MADIFEFLHSQLWFKPPYPTHDFKGQTVIVTGSNVGLGFEAARHIVRLNAEKVILAVRSLEKGDKAKKSIEDSTGRQGVVEVWPLDLASYESVKEFVKRAGNLKRLDAVLENAGIAVTKYTLFEDNESTITVNVVSTFLLALMILPKLRETAIRYNVTPRLTIVSSEVHKWATLPDESSPDMFKTLNDQETADMASRYPVSKLLEVLYCRELATKMTESKKPTVTLNFLNPGLCHSELARGAPLRLHILKFFLARTTEVGSRTLVTPAASGHHTHGQYMGDCKIVLPSAFVLSDEGFKTQQRVFSELNAKLDKIQPGVLSNI